MNRNQHIPHYCGSCWAHATTSALSTRLLLKRSKTGSASPFPEIDFAPQLLLDCDKQDQACYGGDYPTALAALKTMGATTETCNRYVAQGWYKTGRTCRSKASGGDGYSDCYTCAPDSGCAPVPHQSYGIDEFGEIKGSGSNPQAVDQMKAEIFARGSIMVSIAVTDAFENYTGGVFSDPTGATTPEHAVTLDGWGHDSASGKDYWVMRNSWGSWWGEGGWARVELGVNTLGCESNGAWWGTITNYTEPFPRPTGAAGPVAAASSSHPMGLRGAHFDADRSSERYELRLSEQVADNTPPSKYLKADKPCAVVRPKEERVSVLSGPQPWETIAPEDIPAVWDWRAIVQTDNTVNNFLSATRNQHTPQYCGSCWAQGTTSALSDRFSIAMPKNSNPTPNLAAQVILNCGAGGSCDGGEPGAVYQFAMSHGIPDETCQFYTASNPDSPSCSAMNVCKTCHPANGNFSPGVCEPVVKFPNYKASQVGNLDDPAKIKAEVYARGPVAATMYVTSKFENYQSGIYSENVGPNPPLNHEVSIVGFGTTGSEDYWIVRNSWGDAWGEHGFFYITTDVNSNLGITTNVDFAVPDTSSIE